MKTIHVNTPLIESLHLGKDPGAKVWLKIESLQPCGSFKARGIGYACQKYVEKGAKALISSSGGNAGLAVAYSGRCLGIPTTVVVPITTQGRVIDLIKRERAQVIVTGKNWDEAHRFAMALCEKEASEYIHPFDDPLVWEGHATIIDEIVGAGITPDAVVLSVGGGGLLCGVVEGLRRNNLGTVPILAVETKGTDSLSVASLANQHVGIDSIQSLATSLGAKLVAKRAFELLDEHPIVSCVVTDEEAVNGCYRFLEDHRIMVEPACGAGLSTVYEGRDFLKDKKSIVVIVCGGVGVTLNQLEEWRRRVAG